MKRIKPSHFIEVYRDAKGCLQETQCNPIYFLKNFTRSAIISGDTTIAVFKISFKKAKRKKLTVNSKGELV